MQIEGIAETESLALFVIGMAGSGKSTLTRCISDAHAGRKVHKINLDPAVFKLDYSPIYDIRADFPYKKVMSEYGLGPNGAIMTALNLLSSQLNKVMDPVLKLQKDKDGPNLFLIDVPGQIQAFSWSASSTILTAAFSTLMPSSMIFVVDLFRCQNPNSFLSNILFAQSIQTRLELPLVLALNKVDTVKDPPNKEWLKDYDKFDIALNQQNNYLSTLSKSVVLYMSDFFQEMNCLQISAKNNIAIDRLIDLCGKHTSSPFVRHATQKLQNVSIV